MRLEITRRSDLATRAMVELNRLGRRTKSVELAEKADADAEAEMKPVIEAIEGPSDAGRCVLEDRPCGGADPCALHQPWQRARTQLLDELSNSSLATLAQGRQ